MSRKQRWAAAVALQWTGPGEPLGMVAPFVVVADSEEEAEQAALEAAGRCSASTEYEQVRDVSVLEIDDTFPDDYASQQWEVRVLAMARDMPEKYLVVTAASHEEALGKALGWVQGELGDDFYRLKAIHASSSTPLRDGTIMLQ